jgi:hypothetical protein
LGDIRIRSHRAADVHAAAGAASRCENLQSDPRVALSIPHRNHPNIYVEIRGIAEPQGDGPIECRERSEGLLAHYRRAA